MVLLLLAYNDARGIRLIQENTSAIYRKKEGEKDTETRRGTEREHEKGHVHKRAEQREQRGKENQHIHKHGNIHRNTTDLVYHAIFLLPR